jgi:putative methyltransferase (TIGR04325 family)
MKQALKNLLRRCLPDPLLAQLVRARRVHYSGPHASWSAALSYTSGYHTPAILEHVASATREVVAGRAAFERDSVTFPDPVPDPVIIAGLTKARPPAGPLRVLDFGGSLGSSYHQHRRFLPQEAPIEWHIVEQCHYVERGRAEFQTAELRFHHTIAEAGAAGPPHVVLLSSVLQYLEDPWAVLSSVAALPAACWIVARTPFHGEAGDLPIVQHVPASIYRASYPAWILSTVFFVWSGNA